MNLVRRSPLLSESSKEVACQAVLSPSFSDLEFRAHYMGALDGKAIDLIYVASRNPVYLHWKQGTGGNH